MCAVWNFKRGFFSHTHRSWHLLQAATLCLISLPPPPCPRWPLPLLRRPIYPHRHIRTSAPLATTTLTPQWTASIAVYWAIVGPPPPPAAWTHSVTTTRRPLILIRTIITLVGVVVVVVVGGSSTMPQLMSIREVEALGTPTASPILRPASGCFVGGT